MADQIEPTLHEMDGLPDPGVQLDPVPPDGREPVAPARTLASSPTGELITLYPTGDARILGDPEIGTPPELITEANDYAAQILLAYRPAAFSSEPTPFSDALEASGHDHNEVRAFPPPAPAVDETSEVTGNGGE